MFFKKDNVPKQAENIEKETSDSTQVKENPLTIDEEQTDTKIVEELEKTDLGEKAETATILSENEQTSVPTVNSMESDFDIKKEVINTEEPASIATNPHEYLVISEEEKISLYSLIFKFGFLSYDQISKMFSDEIAQKTIQQSKLDSHKIAKDTLFFHNAETIKELAHLSQDNVKELKKEALFWKQIKEENKSDLQSAIKEIEILLTFNEACDKDSNYQLYDWISTSNPRRYRKSMNIKRLDLRRGSLSPNGTITITKKSQRVCLIMNFLPPFSAYLIGERRDKYSGLINAFDMWLSSTEKTAKWIRKMKLYIATEELAAALIFPKESEDVISDLVHRMAEEQIHTPIYLTSYDELIKKPLACWSTNVSSHIFKAKKT